MAAADATAFSIRGYAVSMRGAPGTEGRRPFGVEDLPPMEARRFRWWADELAAVMAAAAAAPAPPPTQQPSRRAQAKARAPKKRSMSDLFASAPPLAMPHADAGGANEAPEVEDDDDEALCAIIRRSKEKKRKRRLEAAAAAAAAAAEATAAEERRESEGNFVREESPDTINLPDELDTLRASKKSEGVHHSRIDKGKSPDLKRKKKITIPNLEKNKQSKKIDMLSYIQSKKANKVGKQHDLKKMLPLHSILKKYTKHTSVKMVKEKHGNAKGTEVIELCRKSVKRVKFAEVNDVLGINQSSKPPPLESLCKLFSDALASSSSSSTDTSSEGDKYIAAESSSSHMPEKAFSKSKVASKNTDHEDSLELTSTDMSSSLIDLNEALPESTDLNCPLVSNSEEPNPEPAQNQTLDSDAQVIDEGRPNQEELSFHSHGLECQSLPDSGLERVMSSMSLGTSLQSGLMEVSDTDVVGPQMKSRGELAETHDNCSNGPVKDAMMKGKSPCALPNRTVHDSVQQQQKWFSFNLNHGGTQLSTEGEVPLYQSQGHNASSSTASSVHSETNMQHECRPAAGQTLRLMGKDLAVSTTRGECLAGLEQEQTHSYTEHHPTKFFLELPRQGRPYLSLQAQSLPNTAANSASTSQSHMSLRYTTPQNFRYTFPTGNALSVDRLQYEDRFRYLSDSQPHQNAVLGCPPRPNHGSAAIDQNSSSPWRRYPDPFCRTAPPSAPTLPTSLQQAPPSSVYHANLPQTFGVVSARSPVLPQNSSGFTFTHPGRIVEEASVSRRDPALPSTSSDNVAARAAVPDLSNTSSSGRCVQRSGPVKLIPGAKHILMPSDSTGKDASMPVYSCVSFGSRRGNVSAPQNKVAELYKL